VSSFLVAHQHKQGDTELGQWTSGFSNDNLDLFSAIMWQHCWLMVPEKGYSSLLMDIHWCHHSERDQSVWQAEYTAASMSTRTTFLCWRHWRDLSQSETNASYKISHSFLIR